MVELLVAVELQQVGRLLRHPYLTFEYIAVTELVGVLTLLEVELC